MRADRDFVSKVVGKNLLGTGVKHLKMYADQGLIRVQKLPGLPARYSREDILALKERCTTRGPVESQDRELVGAS